MTDIKKKMAEVAAEVEASLSEYVKADGNLYDIIYDAMRYSLLGGGKRIRPFIVLEFAALAAREAGLDIEYAKKAAMPYACALEMIHTYSLIHDDLPCMDNDDLRRGKPTCHIKFGEANGLLAGDGLLTLAFGIAAKNTFADFKANCEAVALISDCAGAGGMIGGQILDLIGETQAFDLPTLEKLQSLKTGELIRCAALIGCLAGGGSERLKVAAAEYSLGIGRAFQVIDDILDATGDEKLLGKPIGSDEEKGKTTFLTFLTVDEARKYAVGLTERAKEAISPFAGCETLLALADYLLYRKS